MDASVEEEPTRGMSGGGKRGMVGGLDWRRVCFGASWRIGVHPRGVGGSGGGVGMLGRVGEAAEVVFTSAMWWACSWLLRPSFLHPTSHTTPTPSAHLLPFPSSYFRGGGGGGGWRVPESSGELPWRQLERGGSSCHLAWLQGPQRVGEAAGCLARLQHLHRQTSHPSASPTSPTPTPTTTPACIQTDSTHASAAHPTGVCGGLPVWLPVCPPLVAVTQAVTLVSRPALVECNAHHSQRTVDHISVAPSDRVG